ncbi:Protein GltF [Achromobacter kerstersii]|uniref:Protein GltF n=2 Tax=Achromobacter kerstersii TaxID=1353890 RepID=A0A6S7AUN7_9BURK|nr:Protein GltF [Achromobacter kerstersii]
MTLTKNLSTMAFTVAAITAAAGAHAQSIDVRIIGTITPAACIPVIGGGGVVDFGLIPAASLNFTTTTELPKRRVPFSITCEAPTQVAISVVDNRADSPIPNIIAPTPGAVFGLGSANGANIGGYVLDMEQGSFTADGTPVFTVGSQTNGEIWLASTWGRLQGGQLRSWSLTATGAPVAFSNLSGILAVTAAVNEAQKLPLNDEIRLDGLATLEMVYL